MRNMCEVLPHSFFYLVGHRNLELAPLAILEIFLYYIML